MLRKWTLAISIVLLLSFASLAVSCAILLCTLVRVGARSYDPLCVALTLVRGRLEDIDKKFGDAFRELRTLMRKI